MISPPPGFPRSLLGEPWSVRLAYFQRYTVVHPQLIEARERLVAAIQNSEPNSLVFVFGPTGVGKTTLRLKTEQLLTAELFEQLEQDRGRLAVVSVEAVAPESGSFSWRDYFKRLLQEVDEPLTEYKRELQTGSVSLRSPSRPKPTAGDHRYGVEQALRFRRPAAVMIDEAQHLAKIASGRQLLDQLDVIKSIANRTQTVHVLYGTYDLLAFRNLNGPGTTPSRDIHGGLLPACAEGPPVPKSSITRLVIPSTRHRSVSSCRIPFDSLDLPILADAHGAYLFGDPLRGNILP